MFQTTNHYIIWDVTNKNENITYMGLYFGWKKTYHSQT